MPTCWLIKLKIKATIKSGIVAASIGTLKAHSLQS